MTMTQQRGSTIAVAILLLGWAASVVIRTLSGVDVEVVAEMAGAGLAAVALHKGMSGRGGPGGPDEGAPA